MLLRSDDVLEVSKFSWVHSLICWTLLLFRYFVIIGEKIHFSYSIKGMGGASGLVVKRWTYDHLGHGFESHRGHLHNKLGQGCSHPYASVTKQHNLVRVERRWRSSARKVMAESNVGWLPVHWDQLRAQRSVTGMGYLYLLTFITGNRITS